MTEIEAKFLIPDTATIAKLSQLFRSHGINIDDGAAVDVLDRYLDTSDMQVLQSGWTYRWRDESGSRMVGLKSAAMNGTSIHERKEMEDQVAAFPDSVKCIPSGRVDREIATVKRKQLRELFQVHNSRQVFSIRLKDGAAIELAIDHVRISAKHHKKSAPGFLEFDEVELELKAGGKEALRAIADLMQQQLGLLPSRLSKFQRGLQTAGLSEVRQIQNNFSELFEASFLREMRAQKFRKKDSMELFAYHQLLEQFEKLMTEEPKAWEGLDPAGVHQMRVATRRIRTALRGFKRVLPVDLTKAFNLEFKWLFSALGDVRDLDVYEENFQSYAAEIPELDRTYLSGYRQHLDESRQNARKALIECLSSQRCQALIRQFADFLQKRGTSAPLTESRKSSIGDAAHRCIAKQYRKVLRGGRAIKHDSPDTEMHVLRIDCKRLRYQFEFFRPIYGKRLDRHIKQLKKLQVFFGEWRDACLAIERLRRYADQVPVRTENRGQLLSLGQLIHVTQCEVTEARKRFRDVWAQFDRRGRRKKVLAILK